MRGRTRVEIAVQQAVQAAMAAIPPVTLDYINGVVKTVAAGASVDGVAQVTVTVNGSDTFATYLDSYTAPAVGDLVRVQFDNGSPIIIGRVVGQPSF